MKFFEVCHQNIDVILLCEHDEENNQPFLGTFSSLVLCGEVKVASNDQHELVFLARTECETENLGVSKGLWPHRYLNGNLAHEAVDDRVDVRRLLCAPRGRRLRLA